MGAGWQRSVAASKATRVDGLDRQLQASLMVGDIAERLYHARTLLVGGACLRWPELTMGQREGYRREVETLIQGGK